MHKYLFLLLLSACVSAAHGDIVGYPRVIDGDTLAFGKLHIRMEGIDAPESHQSCMDHANQTYPCGQLAKMALESFVRDREVRCEPEKLDRYKRTVATCYVGDDDLNGLMVSNGWALAYRQYSTIYISEEEVAQTNHVGIWQGQFEAPWVWRHSRRH